VVITGAGRGIGAGLARVIAEAGARALLLVDRDGAAVEAVAAGLRGAYPTLARVDALEADVADPAEVHRFVEHGEHVLGGIDIFVANAGIGGGGGLDADLDVWQSTWDVNVMAHVHAAREVVPRMLARGGGGFVTVASAAGLLTNLGNAPYSVTKHAAVAFAEWLAVAHGEQGLDVACVCPMGIDTDLLRSGRGTLEGESVAALGVLPLEQAARTIVEGLRSGCFLVVTHPETAEYERRRVADRDRWIAGLQRAQRFILDGLPGAAGEGLPD